MAQDFTTPAGRPVLNPFNQSHYEMACKGSQKCGQLLDSLQRLQICGFDTSAQQEDVIRKQTMFDGIKRQFFPDQP